MNKWSLILLVICVVGAYSQADASTDDAQYASMRRTACLVLSRYHSNTQKDVIEQVVQGLSQQDQQAYINKIYATAVQTCEPLINQSEVQELFVENADFDPAHLFHLFETINYSELADTIQVPLTPAQENIVKFAKQFDQQMAIRREQKQAEKGAEGGPADTNEMKILGIAFSKLSGFTKFVYVSIFVSIIGAFLFYGFQKLDTKQDKKNNKRRKSPKKDL